MYNLKVQFTALTKTFKEWEEIYDRVQIIDKYVRRPNIIKINMKRIEKLIELDTRLYLLDWMKNSNLSGKTSITTKTKSVGPKLGKPTSEKFQAKSEKN